MENPIEARKRMVQERIEKSFADGLNVPEMEGLEKARSGVYADTSENRKLGRVGQTYGIKKQEIKNDDSKKKKDKMSNDEAAKFLKEHASKYKDYDYGEIEDDELLAKFDEARKLMKMGKTFGALDRKEAEEYKTQMESKGYHVIDVGEGSDEYVFALIKKGKRK